MMLPGTPPEGGTVPRGDALIWSNTDTRHRKSTSVESVEEDGSGRLHAGTLPSSPDYWGSGSRHQTGLVKTCRHYPTILDAKPDPSSPKEG